MNLADFHSAMSPAMRALIALRQSLGYSDKNLVAHLKNFDSYLVSSGQNEPFLTRRPAEAWAASGTALSRSRRLHALRILGRFLAQSFPESYIPGPAWEARRSARFRPYIYNPTEIQSLLREAARLPPTGSLRPLTYVTLISLLYASGPRISEALALQLGDVDLEEGVLSVRESKFHKSRLLPLHPTVTAGLRHYLRVRNQYGHRRAPDAPFFVNEWKRACNYGTVIGAFLGIARRAGLRGPPGQRGPRIHDLRHNAASRIMPTSSVAPRGALRPCDFPLLLTRHNSAVLSLGIVNQKGGDPCLRNSLQNARGDTCLVLTWIRSS